MGRRKDHPFRAVFREDPLGWTSISKLGYGAGYVGVIHKRRMEERPYRFANEFICGHLAQFLLLPCPPFAVTFFENQQEIEGVANEMLFSSLDFNYERDDFPPPEFDACVSRLAELCSGILAFDILVANPDRRKSNLWCDDTVAPSRLQIFDHDYALFGSDEGVARLESVSDKLGLSLIEGGNDIHPFLKRIASARSFDDWYDRIDSLPEWFIHEVCRTAERYGITRTESNAVTSFLQNRSRHLEELIRKHKTSFEAIADWSEKGGMF